MTAPPRPRLHRPLLDGIVYGLKKIFFENYPAEAVVASVLKSDPRWGSRDRNFVASSIYDIVRGWRLYWEILGKAPGPEGLELIVAVNETEAGFPIPAWLNLSPAQASEWLQNKKQIKDPAILQSFPDWLYARGLEESGPAWEQEAHALNEPAPVVIRCNTLKTSLPELKARLESEGIATLTLPGFPDALQLEKRQANLSSTTAWKEGWFELQDAGSQKIAACLNPSPGDFVVDACAGAGGKALHLAAIMKNKGRLIASDTVGSRLNELKKRASRNGVTLLETYAIAGEDPMEKWAGKADCLLLDVPCSGTGVIRRKPDTKWKLNPEILEQLLQTQAQILRQYPKVLKPGGKMVYATCSLFPSENEKQIEAFLAANPAFRLERQEHLTPATTRTDGFYLALLTRKD